MHKRLPGFPAIVQVYAVIAVMFAGWTITAFAWKLSAWLLLLNAGEIFAIFSYAMAVNFLESLTILLILLAAGALLPAPLLRDDFVARGTILSVGLIGAMMAFVAAHMRSGMFSSLQLLIPPLVPLVLTGFLLVRLSGLPFLRSAAVWVSDRVVIFLFILLPLFVILSGVVIVRNIA